MRPFVHRLGTRKIVLATSIAEKKFDDRGCAVIDAGRLRQPRFDSRSGLTRLETIRVTQDSAEQRRGRAGRLGTRAVLSTLDGTRAGH